MLTEELSTERPPRARHSRRLWWLLPIALVVAGTIVLVLHRNVPPYQPLEWGNTGNDAELFPGLPAGKGIHPVNTVGGLHEDIYIPPQAGVFSLTVTIANTGSRAVVILSVKLPWHAIVWAVGPVRYSWPGMGGSIDIPPPTSRVLHNARLGPGQQIFVGIPVRTTRCGLVHSVDDVSVFYVTYRYQSVTRTVAMPWTQQGGQLILHVPGKPGEQDAICAS